MMRFAIRIVLGMTLGAGLAVAGAPRQMENLTRGVVAVRQPGGVYVGWRLFGTDPEGIAFNLYRIAGEAEPVRVNEAPLAGAANFVDRKADPNQTLRYFVRPVVEGKELAPSKAASAWEDNYLEIPIQPIPEYRPGDASAGDLDGDGQYEIVLHQVSRGRDNSHPGVTGTPVFDAYKLDGTHLWRIDLGINIRDGEHYTQFMVYDLDGDGRAEMVCKTADGTKDGQGKVIGDKDKDWRVHKPGDKTDGRILEGPEFLYGLRRPDRGRAQDGRLHPFPRPHRRLGRHRRQRRHRQLRQPLRPLPGMRRLPGRRAAQRRDVPGRLRPDRDGRLGLA